jgi:hypothetical protein
MDSNEKDDFDLQGRLGCFSLSDLLQTLSFTQKTGTLTLIQGWNTRTICYEQGRITYIAAATRLPSVVELLLQTGRLTVQQLEGKLGKDWKSKVGINPPTHLEPDSAPGMGALPANGRSNGHNGRTGVTSTSPDLSEYGDIDTFMPPDVAQMQSSHSSGPSPPRCCSRPS